MNTNLQNVLISCYYYKESWPVALNERKKNCVMIPSKNNNNVQWSQIHSLNPPKIIENISPHWCLQWLISFHSRMLVLHTYINVGSRHILEIVYGAISLTSYCRSSHRGLCIHTVIKVHHSNIWVVRHGCWAKTRVMWCLTNMIPTWKVWVTIQCRWYLLRLTTTNHMHHWFLPVHLVLLSQYLLLCLQVLLQAHSPLLWLSSIMCVCWMCHTTRQPSKWMWVLMLSQTWVKPTSSAILVVNVIHFSFLGVCPLPSIWKGHSFQWLLLS